MSDVLPPRSLVAGPGFPRLALGLGWFGCSLATGVLARLVGGVTGWMLLSIAVLGIVATGTVASNRHRRMTFAFSTIASLVVAGMGGVATIVAAITGVASMAIGIVPVVGGLVAYRLTLRAQRMSAP